MSDTPATSAPVRPLSTAPSWMAKQALCLLMVAGVLLWVFQTTDIDRQITHLFFDEQQGGVPLRRTWLFEGLLHHSAKQVPSAECVLVPTCAPHLCLCKSVSAVVRVPRPSNLPAT